MEGLAEEKWLVGDEPNGMLSQNEQPAGAEPDERNSGNNLRLLTLAQSLNSTETFVSACDELISWCSDPRAFNSAFEENLLLALQTAVSVASKEGFDLDLVSSLISNCFTHRRHLSKEGAVKIARWYEQMRRRKQTRQKRLLREEEKKNAHSLNGKAERVDKEGDALEESGEKTITPKTETMWQGSSTAQFAPHNYGIVDYGMESGSRVQAISPQMMQPQYIGQNGMPTQQPMAYMQPNGQVSPAFASAAHQNMMMHQQQQRMYAMQQQAMQQQQQAEQAAAMYAGGKRVMSAASPSYPMQSPHFDANRAASQVPMGVYPANGVPGYPNPRPGQMIRAGPPMLYSQMQANGLVQQSVHVYPNPNVHAHGLSPDQDIAISLLCQDLLPPFALDERKPKNEVNVEVTEELFKQLHANPMMDVSVRCFAAEDILTRCLWPANSTGSSFGILISFNGEELLPRNTLSSILLRTKLRQGINSLSIVTKDCTSVGQYKMVVSVIQKASLKQCVQDICYVPNHEQQVLQCKNKMRSLVQALPSVPSQGHIRLRLLDPSNRRIRVPARSRNCRHPDCFDAEVLLLNAHDGCNLMCPICKQPMNLREIEPDYFFGEIIRTTYPTKTTDVMLEVSCDTWIPMGGMPGMHPQGMQPIHPMPQHNSAPLPPIPPPADAPPAAPAAKPKATRKRASKDNTNGTKRNKSEPFLSCGSVPGMPSSSHQMTSSSPFPTAVSGPPSVASHMMGDVFSPTAHNSFMMSPYTNSSPPKGCHPSTALPPHILPNGMQSGFPSSPHCMMPTPLPTPSTSTTINPPTTISQQQPGHSQQQPGLSQQQPGQSQQQPGFSQQQPGLGQQQPGFSLQQHSQQQAGFSQQQPGMSQPQAGFSQQQSGLSQQQPGFSQQQPGLSQQPGPSNMHAFNHQEPSSVAGSAPYTPSSVGSAYQGAPSADLPNDLEVENPYPIIIDDLSKYMNFNSEPLDERITALQIQQNTSPGGLAIEDWKDVQAMISSNQ